MAGINQRSCLITSWLSIYVLDTFKRPKRLCYSFPKETTLSQSHTLPILHSPNPKLCQSHTLQISHSNTNTLTTSSNSIPSNLSLFQSYILPIFQSYTLPILHSSNPTLSQSHTLPILHSPNPKLCQSHTLQISHSNTLTL